MNPQSLLESLVRPQLLVRAARIGLVDYNRSRSLRRIFPGEVSPAPGHGFVALYEQENAINTLRRNGDASYSAARHVEILIALIIEARLAPFECKAAA